MANHVFVVPALLAALILLLLPATASAGAFYQTLLAVLACVAGGLALLYGRLRILFMVLVTYLGFLLLSGQTDAYLRDGRFAPHASLVFNGASVWLPMMFVLNGVWHERGQPIVDVIKRALYQTVALGVFLLLAAWRPDHMVALVAGAHLPTMPLQWSSLPALPTLSIYAAVMVLGIQAVWTPRTEHTAMLLAAVCLAVMLPRAFLDAAVVPVGCSFILLLFAGSIVQETFRMAFRDELTGLRGRRALNDVLTRLDGNYSIAMVDIDHFKAFNDTHGHQTGDQVLRLVAARLNRAGGGSRAYRYGGEEFALVFFGKLAHECLETLEGVRMVIESSRMRLRDEASRPQSEAQGRAKRGSGGERPGLRVTVSIGVSDSRLSPDGPVAVIADADTALYAAKGAGRNQVKSVVPPKNARVKAAEAKAAAAKAASAKPREPEAKVFRTRATRQPAE
ncbi:GGDEF domain-containing protein [Pigmentiphaga aceris]|uniref:diguanylate cyclase n=1 Tax=Pigmentiphaga aceris TaxID=1940612 RepID=A0A5C0AUZ7_9BURK|nr:GGDEF domain-containing protein [Pigmentiphaga aceris]QEI06005.1 GGDEF domain-containing protein [Pigmentiphaga aceris]